MAEESNSKGSLATLTPREQEVLIAGIRNAKSGEIQVCFLVCVYSHLEPFSE